MKDAMLRVHPETRKRLNKARDKRKRELKRRWTMDNHLNQLQDHVDKHELENKTA